MKNITTEEKLWKEFVEFAKNHDRLPKHIGIIMDGNGRWAKQRNLPRTAGHNEGINSVEEIVEACAELGIRVLTLYTFSEENWKRPQWEVNALMNLLFSTIQRKMENLWRNNVIVHGIGHLENLPRRVYNRLMRLIDKTKNNTGLLLNLALSYGSRQELTDTIKRIAHEVAIGNLDPKQINEEIINNKLYTAGLPDPELIIRTGGEYRLSNFLLWQSAYTEIYVSKAFWPEFRKQQLINALSDYMDRERRFGMTSEQVKSKAPVAQ